MRKQPEATALTRHKLMDSFWSLYKVSPIEKITISSITKSAGVHRSTFYEYFNDIYDLLEQLEEDLLTQLKKEFIPLAQKHIAQLTDTTSYLSCFINDILSFFTEYGDVLCHLCGSSGDPGFRKKLFALFKMNFITIHKIPENYPYADYLSSFVFAIILTNLEYWYEHKDTITMQEVITLTYQLIGDGLLNHSFYQV